MSEPVRSIIIQLKGDVTYATMLSGYDGELIARHACARRNPKDAYNRYEGARIALARVLGVDPFPEQKDASMTCGGTFCKAPEKPKKDPNVFKVGDRVRTKGSPFTPSCQNRPGVVARVDELFKEIELAVLRADGYKTTQYAYFDRPGSCLEHWDDETMGVNPFTNKKEARKK